MKTSIESDALLSREELHALLEEMPTGWSEQAAEASSATAGVPDIELQRANEEFAFEQGLILSNRHQRVIGFSLIGQREIEMSELTELMLPTDLAGGFQILPKGLEGFVLLSRPFFFQLLSMSFGSGPTLKPVRPPTREYTRIERRFYGQAVREMLEQVGRAWSAITPVSLAWGGLVSRATVADSQAGSAILATFDVRGFGEACRVRIAIPADAFAGREGAKSKSGLAGKLSAGVSVLEVPLRLRAQVGTADMSLAEVGGLSVGQLIPLDAPADGSMTVRIGNSEKFKGVAGKRGSKRAIQLVERLGGAE